MACDDCTEEKYIVTIVPRAINKTPTSQFEVRKDDFGSRFSILQGVGQDLYHSCERGEVHLKRSYGLFARCVRDENGYDFRVLIHVERKRKVVRLDVLALKGGVEGDDHFPRQM